MGLALFGCDLQVFHMPIPSRFILSTQLLASWLYLDPPLVFRRRQRLARDRAEWYSDENDYLLQDT
jgi:hypothetical protein